MRVLILGCASVQSTGHLSNNYPNKKSVNLVEEGESDEEQNLDDNDYESGNVSNANTWEELACIIQCLLLDPKSPITLKDASSRLDAQFIIRYAT